MALPQHFAKVSKILYEAQIYVESSVTEKGKRKAPESPLPISNHAFL